MKDALNGIDSKEDADTYDVILNYNMTLHFTQTHLMEIQTLFQLIDEYGLPQSDEYDILGEGMSRIKLKFAKVKLNSRRRSLFDDEETADDNETGDILGEEIAATDEELVLGVDDEDSEGVIEKDSFITYRNADGTLYENEI